MNVTYRQLKLNKDYEKIRIGSKDVIVIQTLVLHSLFLSWNQLYYFSVLVTSKNLVYHVYDFLQSVCNNVC